MIDIKNLTFYYKKQYPLFENFSLEVQQGSIVGLLGKNGAGKTTLLNIIAGLLPPKAGSVCVNGFVPAERKPAFLADVSVIPEEFSFPHVKIRQFTAASAPLYPNFDLTKLRTILNEFELKENDSLNKLSHGQRKKFLIAFALASNCKFLLFDEPTNGLDIPSKSQLRKILVSSISDEQIVLISTHQVKDINTIIDKIVVVDKGKTIFNDEIENLCSKFRFETVTDLQSAKNALYSEKSFDGYHVISPNESGEETGVDLELFFNYLTDNKIRVGS
ncbi:MAG: ABC transporter ATP-binding protein [Paludibacter sp.]|nr:ABC transporter ATP-binding protein [Paludibacter sp.]